jgi:dolichol-phosphate mannosyltransferase
MITISIISPAFNEAENLPVMHEQLKSVFDQLSFEWEWIIVDDHSIDNTSLVIERIIEQDSRVRTLRFSRNFGSHAAISAGLLNCSGDCAIIMAADLQDPPEEIPRLIEIWQKGTKIVWAAREKREKESLLTVILARLYYLILRIMTPVKNIPKKGADFWLMDSTVINAVNSDPERHISVPVLIRWMGFSQDTILYNKRARLHGKSNWTFAKKINHVYNTLIATTVVPLRVMMYSGVVIANIGFIYAIFVILNKYFFGNPQSGWSSLMVVILILGGTQMIMMGILGEYLWRTYEESRRRPRFIVEKRVNLKE